MFTRPPLIRQPNRSQRIDWSNPLNTLLLFSAPLHPAWGMRDLVSGKAATKTGLATHGIGREGMYPVFGASNYADFTLPNGLTASTPFTVAWTQEPRSTSSYSTVLNVFPSGAASSFMIYQSADNASYYFAVGPRDGGVALFDAVGAATDGVSDRYVLTGVGGMGSGFASFYTLYRNGVKMTTASTTNFGSNATASFRIGATDSGGDPFEGLLGNLSIWGRVLTDGEAIKWCMNPYGIYVPPERDVWLASDAAGSIAAQYSYYRMMRGA